MLILKKKCRIYGLWS